MNSKDYYDDRFSCYKVGEKYYISLGIKPEVLDYSNFSPHRYEDLAYFGAFVMKQFPDLVYGYIPIFYMCTCAEDVLFYYIYPEYNQFYVMDELDFSSVINMDNIISDLSALSHMTKVDVDKELVKKWYLKNALLNGSLIERTKYCINDFIRYFKDTLDTLQFSKRKIIEAKKYYMKAKFNEYNYGRKITVYFDDKYLYYCKDNLLYCKIRKNSKNYYKVAVYLACLWKFVYLTDTKVSIKKLTVVNDFNDL